MPQQLSPPVATETGSAGTECLYQDEVFQIEHTRSLSLLQLTFRKHPEPEQFRNAYRVALDAALHKSIRLWVTDATRIKSMLPENQSWLAGNMAPLFQGAHLRKFAIVMAPECFVMTNPSRVYDKAVPEKAASPTGNIKIHFDLEAARSWLING